MLNGQIMLYSYNAILHSHKMKLQLPIMDEFTNMFIERGQIQTIFCMTPYILSTKMAKLIYVSRTQDGAIFRLEVMGNGV